MRILLILVLMANSVATTGQSKYDDLLAEINKKRVFNLVYDTDSVHQAHADLWAVQISKSFFHQYRQYCFGEVINHTYDRSQIIPAFWDSKPHKKLLLSPRAKKAVISVYEKPAYTTTDGKYFLPSFFTVIRLYE